MSDVERLAESLAYALRIIEGYEYDIRNAYSDPDLGIPVDLVKEGFCQGSIYMNARQQIMEHCGWSDADSQAAGRNWP